jgi:hypothetical protein
MYPLHYSSYPPGIVSTDLMVMSTGLKIFYSFLYRKYIHHVHLLKALTHMPMEYFSNFLDTSQYIQIENKD